MENIQNKKFGLSNSALHIIANLLMLCDHMWGTIFPQYEILTCIGRMAFPIYAFLTVEGYFRTHDFYGYLKRLFIFALISEVPFDLMITGTYFYPYHNNVLWTFIISLSLIRFMEWAKEKSGGTKLHGKYITAVVISFVFGLAFGTVTGIDYYGPGVWMVLVFYLCYNKTALNRMILVALMYYINYEILGGYYYDVVLFGHHVEIVQQTLALFGLVFVFLYNGEKGKSTKASRLFNYWFYPGHMLVLYILMRLF